MLISLIEAGESSSSTAVSEALFCINAAKPTTNPYSLAVKAYALALANSPDTQAALDQLLKLAKTSAGSLYWELPAQYGKYLKLSSIHETNNLIIIFSLS